MGSRWGGAQPGAHGGCSPGAARSEGSRGLRRGRRCGGPGRIGAGYRPAARRRSAGEMVAKGPLKRISVYTTTNLAPENRAIVADPSGLRTRATGWRLFVVHPPHPRTGHRAASSVRRELQVGSVPVGSDPRRTRPTSQLPVTPTRRTYRSEDVEVYASVAVSRQHFPVQSTTRRQRRLAPRRALQRSAAREPAPRNRRGAAGSASAACGVPSATAPSWPPARAQRWLT